MKFFNVLLSLLIVFFVTACDYNGGTSDYKSFDYELQGTWESNDKTVYSGKLEITSFRITITGYYESQTQNQPELSKNDNKRPFKDFTKGTTLTGYSEEGKIFIEDGGQLQEGIPYTCWEGYSGRFLSFDFGGRKETLQLQ